MHGVLTGVPSFTHNELEGNATPVTLPWDLCSTVNELYSTGKFSLSCPIVTPSAFRIYARVSPSAHSAASDNAI